MNFTEAESAPVPVSLNDPEGEPSFYEGDMMIQESDETKVIAINIQIASTVIDNSFLGRHVYRKTMAKW